MKLKQLFAITAAAAGGHPPPLPTSTSAWSPP